MKALRIAACLALVAPGCGEVSGQTSGDDDFTARFGRVFSSELRQIESRLAVLSHELPGLPSLTSRPFASRYGFRSETLHDQNEPQWLQIDLEARRTIERIVAIPVHIPLLELKGAGYGFPLRFRIEVSDDPEMTDATTVVDRSGEDVANPGRYPMDFRIAPVTGRYVRFTSTRHFPVDDGFIWALEELILLSGNNSLAVWRPAVASSSLDLYPNWEVHRFKDGQSALGLPVTTGRSPTRGYLSALTQEPNERKWLRVDLGREYPIDEVRLVPVESGNFETLGERAFPRGYALELATDPGFEAVVWRFDMPKTNLVGYPGDCAVVVPAPGARGRYLRLVTTALWGVAHQCGYGLAEIQAYADDENVALGKPVEASDEARSGSEWSPSFATDGFSSRHPLIELPAYLDLIARRGALETEWDSLIDQRNQKLRLTSQVLTYGGTGLGTFAVLGWGWMLVRQKTTRSRAVSKLREQIARDLHDDIGSNLGGIVLLSEMGSLHSAESQVREDFSAIKEAAETTAQSMQDIVWLIQRGNVELRDLVTRLRQSAHNILGDEVVSLSVNPGRFRERELSLFFRRHFFFAYKETLNNIRKHARATEVEVRIVIDGRDLSFEIQDNGVGFDPQQVTDPGLGLANLKRRAGRLNGTCRLESQAGKGTRVTFKAPMRKSS